MPALTIEAFVREFTNHTRDWDWTIKGFLDAKGFVHPIDTDTKVLSTVFERLVAPVLRSIAKEHGYEVEISNQTTYPDFTLTQNTDGHLVAHRIAIDVKTTYRSPAMGFTLGSYNSFLRNGTKNILHPYASYDAHWVIGFVYSQNPRYAEYDLDNLPKPEDVTCPYKNVFMFVRNKHEICGLRAGSGNTKNIGSIKVTEASRFATENGPFVKFVRAKDACDFYWARYENYAPVISNEAQLIAHRDFAQFL